MRRTISPIALFPDICKAGVLVPSLPTTRRWRADISQINDNHTQCVYSMNTYSHYSAAFLAVCNFARGVSAGIPRVALLMLRSHDTLTKINSV